MSLKLAACRLEPPVWEKHEAKNRSRHKFKPLSPLLFLFILYPPKAWFFLAFFSFSSALHPLFSISSPSFLFLWAVCVLYVLSQFMCVFHLSLFSSCRLPGCRELPDPHNQTWSRSKIPHHWPRALILCLFAQVCTLVLMGKKFAGWVINTQIFAIKNIMKLGGELSVLSQIFLLYNVCYTVSSYLTADHLNWAHHNELTVSVNGIGFQKHTEWKRKGRCIRWLKREEEERFCVNVSKV